MKAYERLIRYTAFPSASDESAACTPTTREQLAFGRELVREMKSIGISDADIDENGYVYGSIPASAGCEALPSIGFIAHMDTVRDVEYRGVKPRIIPDYDGGDIVLNEEKNIVMRVSDYPHLSSYKGKTLIVTDGTTLLGADDKAGIAEILTACETILNDPDHRHGRIGIAFTPDEEVGAGADHFDIKRFGCDYAYTCDGIAFGDVEYETFNAAGLTAEFNGFNIHPGEAYHKMINSITVANEFLTSLPEYEAPEFTSDREGFYHVTEISGTVEKTVVKMIIRDHDAAILESRIAYLRRAEKEINRKYGPGTAVFDIRESYRNMREVIETRPEIIDRAAGAVRTLGRQVTSNPVRGGTDGSRLSFMGLPCPNLGTGSHNHHGTFEYAVAEEMQLAAEAVVLISRV